MAQPAQNVLHALDQALAAAVAGAGRSVVHVARGHGQGGSGIVWAEDLVVSASLHTPDRTKVGIPSSDGRTAIALDRACRALRATRQRRHACRLTSSASLALMTRGGLPRFLALCLMLPLLTIYADVLGILGGFLVGTSMLHLSFSQYWNQTLGAIDVVVVEQRLKGDPDTLKRTLEKYIIRRPGQPDDIANMVLFLASDASSWITGQVYPVNGGFSFAL